MTKLDQLISILPKNPVILDRLLKSHSISNSLKQKYISYGYIKSMGRGASYTSSHLPTWQTALFALVHDGYQMHIGGRSALAILGLSHFVSNQVSQIELFSSSTCKRLPSWFVSYDWRVKIDCTKSTFLPDEIGVNDIIMKDGIALRCSSIERAILELLYFIPTKNSIEEAYYIMENLVSIDHSLLQKLLEECSSIKVKRLLLCIVEKINHKWVSKLDKTRLDLGYGIRHIVTGGYVDPTYKITIPTSWRENEESIF